MDDLLEDDTLEETLENNDAEQIVHPWRKCGWGEHLVREYVRHKHPDGTETVREYCEKNPSRKEELSNTEILYITETHFSDLTGPPTAGILKFKRANADAYDKEIRGWTRYWNDIFKPLVLLDANLVKALIGTESGFRLDPKENSAARGLMQILNSTREYLGDIHGELRNYLVRLTPAQLLESSPNICAGIRWLFRKKETAKVKLKREPTWIEAIEDYKDLLDKILKKKRYNHKPIKDLQKYYNLLQGKKE